MDALVAHYPTPAERYAAASRINHEISRRVRRSVMTSHVLKVCPACNQARSHDDFRRDATRADGLDGFCRACRTTRAQGL